jgi:hypothetical protein
MREERTMTKKKKVNLKNIEIDGEVPYIYEIMPPISELPKKK